MQNPAADRASGRLQTHFLPGLCSSPGNSTGDALLKSRILLVLMLLLADFSCGQQKSSSQLQFSLTSAESYRFNGQPTEPHMLPNVCAFLGEAYASTGRTREAIVELKLGLASDGGG